MFRLGLYHSWGCRLCVVQTLSVVWFCHDLVSNSCYPIVYRNFFSQNVTWLTLSDLSCMGPRKKKDCKHKVFSTSSVYLTTWMKSNILLFVIAVHTPTSFPWTQSIFLSQRESSLERVLMTAVTLANWGCELTSHKGPTDIVWFCFHQAVVYPTQEEHACNCSHTHNTHVWSCWSMHGWASICFTKKCSRCNNIRDVHIPLQIC